MEEQAHDHHTYIADPESQVEMARLINLDRATTKAMGGPLSGISDLPQEARVLDLACGPGSWVLDVAAARPESAVTGIDISKAMIDYARVRAGTQRLTNASFAVMNITEPLDFSNATFDLVNARFLGPALLREAWQPLLDECTRILKPGGLLRLTEPADMAGITTSAAHERLTVLLYQAFWHAGYAFSTNGYTLGLTTMLPRMMRQTGYCHVHCQAHTLEFSADCEAWHSFYRNAQVLFSMLPPFLIKTGVATQEELDVLSEQMHTEWRSETFCGMWHLVTVLGEKA